MRIRIFLTVVILLLPSPLDLGAQTAEIHSPTEFIIRTVIKNIQENDIIKRKTLAYKRIHKIENLDEKEQIIDKEKEEITQIDIGGKETVVWLNRKPVKRRQATPPDFDMVEALQAMAKLDEFIVISLEMFDSRPCYLISFKAKPAVRAQGDVENIIVRSEGEMYVDIEKFYIKKLSARLVREYGRCWGCFKLFRADFIVEQEEFEGIVVMKSITIIDKFYALKNFGMTFEKKTYTYQDYRKQF